MLAEETCLRLQNKLETEPGLNRNLPGPHLRLAAL